FLEDLPFLGGGREHTADFAEAAGLRVDDEVRVAGLKVGAVTDVGLHDGRVRVAFRVSGVELGDRSRAEERQVLQEEGERGGEGDDQEPDGSEQRRSARHRRHLDSVTGRPTGAPPGAGSASDEA
ncbi:MCE family protein, partial [Saccharothrix sp. MB29]|nr:MCE family protein [Saccharothrix sp. MB29]